MSAGVGPTVGADRRLVPLTVAVVVGLVATVLTGAPGFAAAAVPAAVALALGRGRAPGVQVVPGATPTRVLEGDRWVLDVAVHVSTPCDVDLLVHDVAGHTVIDGATFAGRVESTATLPVELEAQRWGRHRLGTVTVRARRPLGLLGVDRTVPIDGTVRVLPAAGRVDDLLRPHRPRSAAGAHPAPVRGPGTDFADLRPYAPGDRLRDLSWTASARSDQPWVVVHHPERTGAVVLVLDTFGEHDAPAGALDRAARVVWGLARHHLANGDRVGLLASGPAPRWLPPMAGRRARWQVLDALLLARSADRERRRAGDAHPSGVPADAFVLGVSPLQSDAFVAELVHHRRLGRPTALVAVGVADLLAPPADEVERAARRLWALDADRRRANLGRAGVRSAVVHDDVTPAIHALSRAPHRGLVRSA